MMSIAWAWSACPAGAGTPGAGGTAGWMPPGGTRSYTPLAQMRDHRIYLPIITGNSPSPEEQLITAINAERARYGLAALTAHPILMGVAEAHSADMATRAYFAHTGPDGLGPCQRMTRAGYRWWACGENIGAGYPSAQLMLAAWLGSTGHRANILSTAYTDIGIGYVPDGYYHHYWTADFGTTR